MAGGDNAHKTAVPALLVSFVCGIMLGLGVAFGGTVQHIQSTHKLETTYAVLCRNMCKAPQPSLTRTKRSKRTTWHLLHRHD